MTSTRSLILPSQYADSVRLMAVARDLSNLPGIEDAAVVMATEANKGILRQAGLLDAGAEAATANDLVIAVKGEDSAVGLALAEAQKLILARPTQSSAAGEAGERSFRTIHAATGEHPGANLAIISVPGRYAAAEAWDALKAGLHVLLFSDNVSLEDEVALKRYAAEAGLLLMGPGAGTAILNGIGLGFANQVPAGPVGIVSAAGTGLQEVSSLLARFGTGLTQGIGTGGRDLNEAVGGIMMLAGLEALQADPATRVIVLVSKPPAASVAQKILAKAGDSSKPTVVCFLGAGLAAQPSPNVQPARNLEQAALLGAAAAGAPVPSLEDKLAQEDQRFASLVQAWQPRFAAGQRFLRGLYSGGTLCYESQVIWRDLLPTPVLSNAPLSPQNQLPDSNLSTGHAAVDLGEEEFTVGRPHPMIDNDLRIRRIQQEALDPQTAVILLDVVLGYGAQPDPASELGPAVQRACLAAQQDGRDLAVIAALTGTRTDPQGFDRQAQALEGYGVILCETNASAARLAARLVCDR